MYDQIQYDPDTFVMLDRGEVIGWALVNDGWAMFYVRPEYRREGVGRRLAKRVSENYEPKVDPWDDVSQEFFDATGMSKQEVYCVNF
jgi:GNAT superfamily N-acetyltransferase